MSFGITCINNSSELTLSSEGMLLGYLGLASLVSTVQPGTSTVLSFNGYSTYTINWPGPICVGLQLTTNIGGVRLQSMTQSGSTWTITVYCGNGSANAIGFYGAVSCNVHVWGLPTAATGWGAAIFNTSGVVSGDLGRQPLQFNRRLSLGAGVSSASMSGITSPIIIGSPAMSKQESVSASGTFTNRIYDGAWFWDTALGKVSRDYRQTQYSKDDGAIPVNSSFRASGAILIVDAINLSG